MGFGVAWLATSATLLDNTDVTEQLKNVSDFKTFRQWAMWDMESSFVYFRERASVIVKVMTPNLQNARRIPLWYTRLRSECANKGVLLTDIFGVGLLLSALG
jgi:hypothetical protein